MQARQARGRVGRLWAVAGACWRWFRLLRLVCLSSEPPRYMFLSCCCARTFCASSCAKSPIFPLPPVIILDDVYLHTPIANPAGGRALWCIHSCLAVFSRLCLAVWNGFYVSLVVQGGMGLWSSFSGSPTRLQAYRDPMRAANRLWSACIAFWNCSRFLGSFALASLPLFFSIRPFRPLLHWILERRPVPCPLKFRLFSVVFSIRALFVLVLCKLSEVERRVEPFLRRCLTHCAPNPGAGEVDLHWHTGALLHSLWFWTWAGWMYPRASSETQNTTCKKQKY